MSKKTTDGCAPGEILKKGYRRKGYQRNAYTKKSGSKIPATYVSASYVPPTCIKDVGKPGKGPKILPTPGNEIHLSKYGYGVHKSTEARRKALREAIKDYNTLLVLRRLNLIRNIQGIKENKDILSDDVEYLKKKYSKISRTGRKKSQKGGMDSLFQDPLTSDMTVTSDAEDLLRSKIFPIDERFVEINTIIDRNKVCDSEGNCGVRNIIYENHIVDGKQVTFYTLGEKDVSQISEFNKLNNIPNDDQQEIFNQIIKIEDCCSVLKLMMYFKVMLIMNQRTTWKLVL